MPPPSKFTAPVNMRTVSRLVWREGRPRTTAWGLAQPERQAASGGPGTASPRRPAHGQQDGKEQGDRQQDQEDDEGDVGPAGRRLGIFGVAVGGLVPQALAVLAGLDAG